MRSSSVLFTSVACLAALVSFPAMADKDEPQAPAATGQVVADPIAPQPAPPPIPAAPPQTGPIFVPVAQIVATPDGPGCPDPALGEPNRERTGAYLTEPISPGYTVAGGSDLTVCGIDLPGVFQAEPTYSPVLSEMEGYFLSVQARGLCDTVLLVRDSDGQWLYANDTGNAQSPHIELHTGLDGRVDFWVGTPSGEECRHELRILASTGPVQDTPAGIAAAIEGTWRASLGLARATLTLTQASPGQWTGSVHFMGEDTALHSVLVDAETGRFQFSSTADRTICYGILDGDYLDGGCFSPDFPTLLRFEGYRGD